MFEHVYISEGCNYYCSQVLFMIHPCSPVDYNSLATISAMLENKSTMVVIQIVSTNLLDAHN